MLSKLKKLPANLVYSETPKCTTASSLILLPTKKQDAQLWQRDRAARCVIVFAKVEDWNWETIFYGHYRSIFNHCDIIGLKICRIP